MNTYCLNKHIADKISDSLPILVRKLFEYIPLAFYKYFYLPLMAQNNLTDMTDSEIIELLGEYNFKEKEMSKILKELKARDFESVLLHIESIKNSSENQDEEKEKLIIAAKERNKMLKKEAEIYASYKTQLLEKIKANRAEQTQREEIENKNHVPVEKTVKIDSYIKIRAIINGNGELLLGFDKDATIHELFERISEKMNVTSLTIKRFGHADSIVKSDKQIIDEFKAKSIMIEVEF